MGGLQEVAWFGSYLNRDESQYKNKVLSIVYNYTDCEWITGKNTEPTSLEAVYPFLVEVKEAYTEKYTLIKMNNDESNKLFFPLSDMESGKVKVKDAKDFFQYVLIINGSGAAQR